MRSILTVLAVLLTANLATAQEVTLGRSGSDNVFVWKDSEAHSEAIRLIQAGVHQSNPALVFRLLSCLVPTGTKAIINSRHLASYTILVTSGKDAGCRGVVPVEDVPR